MKLLPILFLAVGLQAQTATPPHSVTLAWQDTQNPSGTTYNAYRAAGDCITTPPVFAKINLVPITSTNWTDQTVSDGRYCYQVTAVDTAGNESAPSNSAVAFVKPFPPTTLTAH